MQSWKIVFTEDGDRDLTTLENSPSKKKNAKGCFKDSCLYGNEFKTSIIEYT